MSNIVIIGSGIAGVTVAESIRETDKDSSIFLVGKEDFYPYNRIKLSKSLDKDLTENEILLKPKEWYRENNIELLKGIELVSISSREKTVKLSNGENLKYDTLVLATGANSFLPPVEGAEKQGVFTLRTLEDSWNIRKYLKNVENVIIIGGGVLGLENAYSLALQGKNVSVLVRDSYLMAKQIDKYASSVLEEKLKEAGVEILFETSAEKLLGENQLECYLDSHGKKHKVEMAIFSTGIKPNTDIQTDEELKRNRGLTVDNKMRTSIKDVYAVGDLCECEGINYGLWSIARSQGIVAAENILGKDSVFVTGASMMSLNSFGISLFSVGTIAEKDADYIVKTSEKPYKKVIVKDDMIRGAILFDDSKTALKIKRLIEKREKVSKDFIESLLK